MMAYEVDICEDDFYRRILDNLSDGVYLVDPERRIAYWNKGAEAITGYSFDEVVGTHCFHNLLRHVDEGGEGMCSRHCPLAKTLADGEVREDNLFLHHKQGHRVPVRVRVSPLRDESGKITGAVEVFTDDTAMAMDLQAVEELKKLALLDPLTDLGNRRFGEMSLHTKLDELKRYGVSFGVLFIDIDKFKRINDAFGHEVGDEVLKMVSRTMATNLRTHDVACRWGGEEFVAVISHLSDSDQLLATARKLVALMDSSSISSGDEIIHVTISIGAAMAEKDDTSESLVKRADRLMYESKEKGGNTVSANPEN